MNLEKAKLEFIKYTQNYDLENENIERKQLHSLRVMDISNEIAKALNLEQEEIDLATLIGLLHDIARFEQYTQFKTYKDLESFDHGDFGAQILEKDIRKYVENKQFDEIIIKAVKNHNKFKIEEGLTKTEELYDMNRWIDAPVMKTGDVKSAYENVINGIDKILEEHGYLRTGKYYKVEKANTDTLVFFCHLGVQFVILSHILSISPSVLWQNFYVAPTSVTILETEEREKGIAAFRCKTVGDTSHLYAANEPLSSSGFFEEVFE